MHMSSCKHISIIIQSLYYRTTRTYRPTLAQSPPSTEGTIRWPTRWVAEARDCLGRKVGSCLGQTIESSWPALSPSMMSHAAKVKSPLGCAATATQRVYETPGLGMRRRMGQIYAQETRASAPEQSAARQRMDTVNVKGWGRRR